MTTPKPRKTLIPLADALRLAADPAFQTTQKLDGSFNPRVFNDSILAGELVGGIFTAFDCVQFRGQDCRRERLRERWEMMLTVCGSTVPIVPVGGAAWVQWLLDNGREGAVFKRWDAPYAEMYAVKRSQDFVCRVTETGGGRQSVGIADAQTGASRGRVALFGGKADRVRVGSTIKVTGFGLTEAGLIREPRPCADTATSWMVRF